MFFKRRTFKILESILLKVLFINGIKPGEGHIRPQTLKILNSSKTVKVRITPNFSTFYIFSFAF